MLMTIDPGSDTAGIAFWRKDRLAHACMVRYEALADMVALCRDYHPVRIVCESQSRVFQRPGARINVASILTLARAAGVLAGTAAHAAGGADIEWIDPNEWKGNTPKPGRVADPYIVAVRAQARLTLDEQTQVVIPKSVKAAWDVWDAVGIGLVYLGRARRGLV